MTPDEIKQIEQDGPQPGDSVGTWYDESGRFYIVRQLHYDADRVVTILAEPQLTDNERELLFAPLIDTVRDRLIELSKHENNLHYALHWELVKYLACDLAANNAEFGELLEAFVRKARSEQCESGRWAK
jgi:hypothetical protein